MAHGHRTTRIAHVPPCAPLQPRPFRFLVVLFGIHPFIKIARQIINTKIALAPRPFATRNTLVKAKQLRLLNRLVLRIDLVERRLQPGIVDVAHTRISFVPIRKWFFARPLTRRYPLTFPAQTFSLLLAHRQRVIPIHHHGRMRSRSVWIFVPINAIPLPTQIRQTLLFVLGKLIADDDVVRRVVRLVQTIQIRLRTIRRVDKHHIVRTRRRRFVLLNDRHPSIRINRHDCRIRHVHINPCIWRRNKWGWHLGGGHARGDLRLSSTSTDERGEKNKQTLSSRTYVRFRAKNSLVKS